MTQGLSDDEDEEEEENDTTQNDNGAMAAEHGHESDSVRDDTPGTFDLFRERLSAHYENTPM